MQLRVMDSSPVFLFACHPVLFCVQAICMYAFLAAVLSNVDVVHFGAFQFVTKVTS